MVERQNPLQPHIVLPIIAKVVLVEKTFAKSKAEARQTNLLGVVVEDRAANVIHTEVLAVNPESVKVGVRPPYGDLNRVMKIGNAAFAADQNPTPNHWTDTPQHHSELINDGFDGFWHGAIVSRLTYLIYLPRFCPALLLSRTSLRVYSTLAVEITLVHPWAASRS